MNLKKPKFWDQKKTKYNCLFTTATFITIRFTKIVKIKKKNKKI
jgi:hypothetical protein